MKIFIYILVLTKLLQFGTAHLSTCFRGSSRVLFNYIHFCTGIGGFATIALFIWACFITTWWVPIAAYLASILLSVIVPKNVMAELICSFLFPLAFIASVVLIVLNI